MNINKGRQNPGIEKNKTTKSNRRTPIWNNKNDYGKIQLPDKEKTQSSGRG